MRWNSLIKRGKFRRIFCWVPRRLDSGVTCWLEHVYVKWQARQILTEEDYQKMMEQK